MITALNIKPNKTKRQRIDMLMTQISSSGGSLEMEAELTKFNKTELLAIDNSKYCYLIMRYQHLDAVRIGRYSKKLFERKATNLRQTRSWHEIGSK